jgi:two-component system response regulator AtoC
MATESLPKRPVEAGHAGNLPQPAEKFRPPRVLVVDDEVLMRWSVVETLTEQGWQVVEAADAASAMDTFYEIAGANGVVLLDLRLPDANDLQVLAAMRRRSPGTPVILMTAQGTPALVEAAHALGAWAVIDRPFDLNDLAPLVHKASESAGTVQPVQIRPATGRSI